MFKYFAIEKIKYHQLIFFLIIYSSTNQMLWSMQITQYAWEWCHNIFYLWFIINKYYQMI
jgi:hypothetical protein